MKILAILILTLSFSQFSWGGEITLTSEEYAALTSGSGGIGDCFSGVGQTMNDGLSNNFDLYSDRTDQLMQEAKDRFQAAAECRNDLQQDWLQWEAKKNETKADKAMLPIKIRQAELAYKNELLKIEAECRTTANTQFEAYRTRMYSGGTVTDPTIGANFNNKVNSAKDVFFQTCYRDPISVKRIDALAEQLQTNIDAMNIEISTKDEAIRDFHTQILAVQKEKLRTCEDSRQNLQPYLEKLAQQRSAKQKTVTKQQQTLGLVHNVASCVGSMMGRAPATDMTSSGTSEKNGEY